MTSVATRRRLQVVDLRIRLELLAAAAFDAVCFPTRSGQQGHAGQRLIYLIGLAPPSEQSEVHRLIHLGVHVYQRTSDVLHGRLSSLDLPDVVIAEWREVVLGLESVLQRHGTRPEVSGSRSLPGSS